MTRARLNARNLRRAAVILGKILFRIGLFGGYRRAFWRFALPLLCAGRVDDVIAVALVAHHMIRFAGECTEGSQNAAFYADRPRAAERATAA